MKPNPLIGKTITAVFLAEDKKAMRFDLADGDPIVVRADGDCCSSTWIEEVQGIDQIIGSPIVAVEGVGGVKEDSGEQGDECIAYYGCKITSGKGYALIDYRNQSNGYYGGNLSWPNDDYFYGGVHGQNISKEEWKQIGDERAAARG